MKKIVSMILCLLMLLNLFSFTYAAEYTAPSNSEEFAGLLSALGIINPDDYLDGKRIITRGEFTSLVIKAEGLSGYLPENANVYFSDVPAEHPYASYIALAKERKLSLGYSDGTFRPDDAISYAEAVVYLIRIMGYTDLAESQNGYPYGYILTAERSGISSGIKLAADYTVTAEIALHLIFNALNTRVMVMNTFEDDGDSFEAAYGNTLMYESFRVSAERGIADEVSLSALAGKNNLPPYSISVNNVVMDVGEFSPRHLLGYNVNAYYKNTDSKNVLIYIYSNPDKNVIKSVDIENITDISGFTIKYEDNYGKIHSIGYERGAAVIYNGVLTKEPFNTSIYSDAKGNRLSGTVELLDNDGDGTNDVVFINAYEEYIVGQSLKAQSTIYDKYDSSRNIKLDIEADDPYTVIYDKDGNEISFSNIEKNASIVVYHSKNAYQGYIRAYMSTEFVEGMLESKDEDELTSYITVSGKSYKLTSYALKNFNTDLIGKKVTVRLNVYGEAAAVETFNPDGSAWGMLVYVDSAKNVMDTPKIYIMDEAGITSAYDPGKYIYIDNRIKGYNFSDSDDLSAANNIFKAASEVTPDTGYTGSNKLNTMIKYRLNDEGKIISVDTALTSSGAAATRADMTVNDSVYAESLVNLYCTNYRGWALGAKTLIDPENKVFIYPADEKADYNIYQGSDFYVAGDYYDGYAFYSEPDSIVAEITVHSSGVEIDYSIDNSAYFGMVYKVTEVVDEDGVPSRKVYIYRNNKLLTYICDPMITETTGSQSIKIKDLQPGDIIYYTEDKLTGKIRKFGMCYTSKDNTVYDNFSSSYNQYIKRAYPYKITSEGMQYVYCDSKADILNTYKNGNFRATRFDDRISVTIYDTKAGAQNRVKTGSFNDIVSYLTAGNDCSEMIIHTYGSYHMVQTIFLIRR